MIVTAAEFEWGNALRDLGEHKSAIAHYRRAIDEISRNDDPDDPARWAVLREKAFLLEELAKAQLKLHDYESVGETLNQTLVALTECRECLPVYERSYLDRQTIFVRAQNHLFLASLLSMRAQSSAARKELERGRALSEYGLFMSVTDQNAWDWIVSSGKASMELRESDAVFRVDAEADKEYHITADQGPIPILEGQRYVLELSAKSPTSSAVEIKLRGPKPDFRTLGFLERLQPGTEYEDFRFEFTADNVDNAEATFQVVLGKSEGEIWIRSLSLFPAID